MNMGFIKMILFSAAIILIALVASGVLNFILSILPFFYSRGAFITCFAVGGIFAGMLAYAKPMTALKRKTLAAHWTLVLLNIGIGAICIFVLSPWKADEYEVPLMVFGIALALSTLFFIKPKLG